MAEEQKDSCLVNKLGHFINLGDVDAELLAALEKEIQNKGRGTEIWSQQDSIENLFVVKDGWLASYMILEDGRRQILEIHYPGDIVGLADLPFWHATSHLKAITDCVLCPFPKSEVDVIFRRSPRLTALLFTLAMIDKAVNTDRLRVLGRMSARERVAHILLEVHSRLQLGQPELGFTFRLPLSQFDIADALGLTNVSVSNSLQQLQKDSLIERSNGFITLNECESLSKMSGFVNRYHEIDIGWFPHAK